MPVDLPPGTDASDAARHSRLMQWARLERRLESARNQVTAIEQDMHPYLPDLAASSELELNEARRHVMLEGENAIRTAG